MPVDLTDSIYHRLFNDYIDDVDVFIETGTYQGGAVDYALSRGIKEVHTVEFNMDFYESLVKKYDGDKRVNLYHGSSSEVMPQIMSVVNKRALIWLDAHDTFGTGGGVPTVDELLVIMNHEINNHTILIDDIPMYFGNGEAVRKLLLAINPAYEISMVENDFHAEYVMVARVDV